MSINNTESNSLFQKDDCLTHVLEFQRYCDAIDCDEGFFVIIWSYGRNLNILGWKERLQ